MHCRFSVLSEQFSAPKMGKANVKYLLEEHDRYLYQRKVPLDMQSSVDTKKWCAPLGPDMDNALDTRDTLREIKKQHDALIDELENPDCGGGGSTSAHEESLSHTGLVAPLRDARLKPGRRISRAAIARLIREVLRLNSL